MVSATWSSNALPSFTTTTTSAVSFTGRLEDTEMYTADANSGGEVLVICESLTTSTSRRTGTGDDGGGSVGGSECSAHCEDGGSAAAGDANDSSNELTSATTGAAISVSSCVLALDVLPRANVAVSSNRPSSSSRGGGDGGRNGGGELGGMPGGGGNGG
eukprot:1111202-Prymnesium_polylepis.3